MMKLSFKTLLTVLAAFLLCTPATQAQTDMSKWSIGIFPSILQYHGSDGNEFFKVKQSTIGVGLGVGRSLGSSFDLEGHFMGGNLDWPATDSMGTDFETSVFDLGAQIVYKFANGYILKEDARIAPFLFAGVNGLKSEPGYGADFPLGGGLNFRFDDLFSMQWRSMFKPTTRDEFNMIQHSLGFVWHMGDGEGKAKAMPDRDNDGIVDIDDNCPDEPGIAANNGCPEAADRDNDGIADADDRCPDVAGVAANNGCPEVADRDKDGIPDANDRCPDVAGVANNQGCPEIADRDKDGIADADDKCPDEAGIAANNGCPEVLDRDNDGIADADDKCPDEAGIAANNGCPELDDETKNVLDEALHGIHFQTGKDLLTEDSKPVLDHVVSLLNKHPEYGLTISGYTDSAGDDAMNLDLSKRRAKRAKDYLISHGIDASRLQSEGYGEANPIADNSTPEGRAQNRRVVLDIRF